MIVRGQQFYDAVLLNDPALLRELLDRVNLRQSRDATEREAFVGAFREAIRYDRREIVDVYLTAGISPNVRGSGDVTPLMWAADSGAHDLIGRLLQAGAEIDSADYRGWTALFYAVSNQDLTAVKLLVAPGADIQRRVAAAQGGTPLDLARFAPVSVQPPDGSATMGRSLVPVDTPVAKYLQQKLADGSQGS